MNTITLKGIISVSGEPIYTDRTAYTGSYSITPKANEATVLATKDKRMTDDLTVIKVPYSEVSNLSGGYTAYIAQEVNE